ncbi:MAG: hypothetical protein JWL77_1633 [Chthonomonadaceae bacterium]|nr:hypothetical protein [Chthonomonadaceae bacterium]
MENMPPPADPPSSRLRSCPLCRTPNRDWLTHCFYCGAVLPHPEQAAQAEIDHIAYLLWQLPWWRSRDLLSPDAETKLNDEYADRQSRLQERAGGLPMEETMVPPPVVPPLPVELFASNPIAPLPSTAPPMGFPAAGQTPPTSTARPPVQGSPGHSSPPTRNANVPNGIAVFLQEHALKIVFALATVLVLIALRSILGWNATSTVFHILTPLVPLGLTAMFWQFGSRTQKENPWAAFVYQGLTAVLLGFDLFMLNRFWLTTIGIDLPSKPLLLMACAASTVVCGLLWRRHRYTAMWHLFQVGNLTTLYTALQAVKLILWHQTDWRSAPLLLFGLAFLATAIVYFARAVQSPGSTIVAGSPFLTIGRPACLLWANLSVAIAFVLSAITLALDTGLHTDDFLLVVLLAGALYGVIAQALEDARLVYVAAVLCLASGLAWAAPHLHPGASSYGVLFLAISTAALAFHIYNRRFPGRRSLAQAWKNVALAGNTLGLLLTGSRTLFALFTTLPSESPSLQLLRTGLALVCGLQFCAAAVLEREPTFCYPAFLSGGIALVSLLQVLQIPLERFPLALIGYAALLLVLSYVAERWVTSPRSQAPTAPALHDAVRNCGKIALGLGLAVSSAFAVGHPHSPWLVASLLASGVFCSLLGTREAVSVWRYAGLYSLASACGLLTLIFAPGSVTFSNCMLAFVFFSAAGAFTASRVRMERKASPDPTHTRLVDLWREPLTDAGLIALTATLFAAWAQIHQKAAQPHLVLDTAVCILAALLLAASRHTASTDSRRVGALVLLNAATALGIAQGTGLASVGSSIPTAAWQHFTFGLLVQSWGYWLIARALYLFTASEVWSEDLSRIEMAPAAFASLLAATGAFWPAAITVSSLAPPLVIIGGAFALFHAEMLRTRKTEFLILSAGALLLAGLTLVLSRDGIQPYPALTLALFSVLAAGSYLQLARRLDHAEIAWLTVLPLLGGALLAVILSGVHPAGTQDRDLANMVWVTGGTLLAWNYRSTARWSKQESFVYASGLTLIAAYLRGVTWGLHLPAAWGALLLLPLLVGMGALSLWPPKGWELLHIAYLQVAVTASAMALVGCALFGDGVIGTTHAPMPNLVTATFAAYGVAYLAWTAVRKTPTPLAAGATALTLAYLNLLLTRTPVLASGHATLSWPLFAFLAVQGALVWIAIGALLKNMRKDSILAAPLLGLAQAIALFSAVCAVISLQEPQQGALGILTLVWAAGIWFGLWALDQGEICLHVGTGNLLVAWCVTIYHTMGVEIDLLDVYLLPFGLYLLLMGHLLSRRQKQNEAQTFWGVGLLVTLTPALLTRWMHAPGWHAALLLSECVVCVLWGVAQRIRVFVAGGLGTILLYAASVSLGILPDILTTVLALVAGVGLFVFGFYALTHQEMMKRLAAAIQQRWTVWHSWR